MTRGLRGRHRLIWPVLGVLMLTGYGAGLLARPGAAPPPEPRPTAAAADDGSDDLWSELRLSFATEQGVRSVVLHPVEAVAAPDILVYYTVADDQQAGVPEGAHFLGTLAGTERRRFTLPPGDGGRILLYSLGHQKHLGSTAVPKG